MSNRRKPAVRNRYRSGFLRSPSWFARRDQWFRNETSARGGVRCAACQSAASPRELELHHLDYTGVAFVDGRWQARELHDDLVALHPSCHERLHRMIDRDVVLARLRTRRNASLYALDRMRAAFTGREADV